MKVIQVYTNNEDVYYISEKPYQEQRAYDESETGFFRTEGKAVIYKKCKSIMFLDDKSVIINMEDYNFLIPYHNIKKIYQR